MSEQKEELPVIQQDELRNYVDKLQAKLKARGLDGWLDVDNDTRKEIIIEIVEEVKDINEAHFAVGYNVDENDRVQFYAVPKAVVNDAIAQDPSA